MRAVAFVLVVLLASCAETGQLADSSASASAELDPTAADDSGVATPSAAPESAPSTNPMEIIPLEDPAGAQGMGALGYFPPSYVADGEPSPLLVFLHGAGEAGDGSADALALVDDLGIPDMIVAGEWPEERPFVVLAPQISTARAEGECGIADELDEFLDWALVTYNVDRQRVYLTGVSCGAIGIWDYLAAHGAETVAAAIPIAGHALWALEDAGCEPLAEVPIWAFHGAEDEIVPISYVEEQIHEIAACEGVDAVSVELSVYPGLGHVESIDPTYDGSGGHDIYAWLLDHTNDSAH